MRNTVSVELYNYWNKLRGSRAAPARNAIEPADIRKILPSLFILEKTSEGDILFRLAGTKICTLFGQEFRGMEFAEAWDDNSADRINTIASDVMSSKNPAILQAHALQADDTLADIEVLILPLTSDGNLIDRAIGCITVLDRANPFLYEPIQKMTLDTNRVTLGNRVPSLFDNRTETGNVRHVTASKQSSLGNFFHKVMHLRVFEGGRHE